MNPNPEKVAADVAEMKLQIREMYTALCGDKITKNGGLVRRTERIEERQDVQEDAIGKALGRLARVGFQVKILWFCAGSILTGIFTLIIKK